MNIHFFNQQPLNFAILLILYLSIVHVLFKIFLSFKPIHQFNRMFLWVGCMLSILLPIFQYQMPIKQKILTNNVVAMQGVTIQAIKKTTHYVTTFNWYQSFMYLIVGITILFVIYFFYKVFKICKFILQNKKIVFKEYKIIYSNEMQPGSFFNYIFLNTNSENEEVILNHEIAHAKLFHSFDKLFLEFLLSVFWWCFPLYFIKKELYLIHEYQADNKAKLIVREYAQCLIQHIFNTKQLQLTNTFFHHPLKLRIKMLNKKITTSNKIARMLFSGFSLSLFAILLISLQSFKGDYKFTKGEAEYLELHKNDKIPITIFWMSGNREEIDSVVERINLATLAGQQKLKYYQENGVLDFLYAYDSTGKNITECSYSFNPKSMEAKKYYPKGVVLLNNTPVFVNEPSKLIYEKSKTNNNESYILNGKDTVVFTNSSDLVEQLKIQDAKYIEKAKLQLNTNDENRGYPIVYVAPNVTGEIKRKSDTVLMNNGNGKDTMIVSKINILQPYLSENVNFDDSPEFKGGEEELQKYLTHNLKYPTNALKNKIEGVVIVEFILNKNGTVTKTKLVKKVNKDLDNEALRVIKAMPAWHMPTKGKNVGKDIYYQLPISFVL